VRCAASGCSPGPVWSSPTQPVSALVAVITEIAGQIEVLDGEVNSSFGQHPDAEIYLSQPGLGPILGAPVLAEFGDDPHRFADVRARKNYSRMSPITRASGTKRVVLARHVRNRRLADALYLQAFTALTASPGARAYYDKQRARVPLTTRRCAPSATGSSASLHGCLRHNETTAWPPAEQDTTTAAA
jgi:transposase